MLNRVASRDRDLEGGRRCGGEGVVGARQLHVDSSRFDEHVDRRRTAACSRARRRRCGVEDVAVVGADAAAPNSEVVCVSHTRRQSCRLTHAASPITEPGCCPAPRVFVQWPMPWSWSGLSWPVPPVDVVRVVAALPAGPAVPVDADCKSFSNTVSAPPRAPSRFAGDAPTGTVSTKFGTLNVVEPLPPPYTTPIAANRSA